MQTILSQTALAFRDTASAAEARASLAIRAGVHHVLSGSFKSTALYLLAFDPVARTLSVASSVPAYGPHQYLAASPARDRVYATTWADPPVLSAWAVRQDSASVGLDDARASDPAVPRVAPVLTHLGNVDITATSSYISASNTTIYSAGGPTAELHAVNADGGFGEKIQQLQFVSDEQLPTADKTRKALRVGSHGFDLTPDGKAFIPHLGHNSIYMYETDTLHAGGHLNLLDEVKSPREHDGPRHVWPSDDGKLLYAITEHTNFVDVYEIKAKTLKHIQSGSIVPKGQDPHKYRGNTLRPSRDRKFLFASTRGGPKDVKGVVAAFGLDSTGRLASEDAIAHYEAVTSCGIAGAIEPAFWQGSEGIGAQDYLLHVDEDAGYVTVLGWSATFKKFSEVASTQLPDGATASHAIWLS